MQRNKKRRSKKSKVEVSEVRARLRGLGQLPSLEQEEHLPNRQLMGLLIAHFSLYIRLKQGNSVQRETQRAADGFRKAQ